MKQNSDKNMKSFIIYKNTIHIFIIKTKFVYYFNKYLSINNYLPIILI
jgi:hypothetical protein